MTWQEKHDIISRYEAQARNIKKYHTDVIERFKNKIVAEDGNWILKLTIYDDKSAALYAVAKPGSGCTNCQYCGTDILRHHFKDLKRINKHDAGPSLIPEYWHIIEPDFFAALNIE